MQRNLRGLADENFDLLIIGGGIYGAGVARDAALRGLRVGLVERADFASGTSSRSSKLIHGGFRYLEQKAFGLVAEASRERRILQDIAPHRVKPLPFLLPVYENDPRALWKMRLGMTLYDLLAMFRNNGMHRTLSPEDVAEVEPGLDARDLRGAIRFFDCQEDDARFCLDNIFDAARLGAVCANYCEVTGMNFAQGRVMAVTVNDQVGGHAFEVRAKVFVNAAGPWVDRIAKMLPVGGAGSGPFLSPTKGIHILLPRLAGSHGIFFQGRSDGRMMFILPWHDCSLVGTTDTNFEGDPANVRADDSDVEYLLSRVAEMFPQSSLKRSEVIATTSGIRPLLKSDSSDPSARSREHQLVESGANFISMCGGKYTTYRLVARQAVDRVYEMLGQSSPDCRTGRESIADFRPQRQGEELAKSPQVFASDIAHGVREEMALTVEDLMWRRTSLMLSKAGGGQVAHAVSKIAQPLLGWNDQQAADSVNHYLSQRCRGV